jgi:hypothetical protein
MSIDKRMETAQLLARFKLQVKRSLAERVDLEAMTRDPLYAKRRLSEIEDAAEDEDLLVMVLRLRDHLLPWSDSVSKEQGTPAPEGNCSPHETRSYLMGARAW